MVENLGGQNKTVKKRVYKLEGKEFYSVRELAEYCGVNEKTITARLRRGLSVEAACEKKNLQCKYFVYEGESKPLCQICKEQEKKPELVRNRLRYGFTLKDALNKPKKVGKQGKPIVVNGILYNSISMACRKLHLEDKECTIRRRLKAGKTPDDAFKR